MLAGALGPLAATLPLRVERVVFDATMEAGRTGTWSPKLIQAL